MALNVKQKHPGTQGGAAQLYASDTRMSLRRREQVFTRLSKSYKKTSNTICSAITLHTFLFYRDFCSRCRVCHKVLCVQTPTRPAALHSSCLASSLSSYFFPACRRYLTLIFFVVMYVCSARLFCV